MHRHGLDAHLAAGAVDAKRNLTAVGDQDLVEHRRAYSTIISGSPNSTGRALSIRICITRAGLGRLDRVEGLHRLDDQERLARCHLVADRHEVGLAGLGREIGGADHRRLDRPGCLPRSPLRRCGRRCAAGGRRGDGGRGGGRGLRPS